MNDSQSAADQAGRQRDLDREQAIADLEQSIADRDQVASRDDQKVEDEEHPRSHLAPATSTGPEPQSRHQEILDHTQAKHGRHQRRLDRGQAGRTERQDALDAEPDLKDDQDLPASGPEGALDPEAQKREDAALTRAEEAVLRAEQALERAEAARDRAVTDLEGEPPSTP